MLKTLFTYRYQLLFAIVLIVAAILRTYDYRNRMIIHVDAARDAIVGYEGARTLQFPLTGTFISIAPVTTGPWFWGQLIAANLVLQTPFAPWILLVGYSIIEVWLMYVLGTLLVDRRLGLLLAFITAIAPNHVYNATNLTNPTVISFYTSIILVLYSLLYKKPQPILGLLLGLIIGVTLNTHYQTLGFLIFPLLLFLFRGKKYLRTVLYAYVGIGVTFIPLLFFELNNHWYNTRHMIDYILIGQYRIWLPTRWLTYLFDFWPRYLTFVYGGTKIFGLIFMAGVAVLFLHLLRARRLTGIYVSFLIIFLLQVVIVRYYRGEKFFGYLQAFVPFLTLFAGLLVYRVYRLKYGIFAALILMIFVILNAYPTVRKHLEPQPLTVETYKRLDAVTQAFGDGPYKIYKCGRAELVPEISALTLLITLQGKYDTGEGIPLVYGVSCPLPESGDGVIPTIRDYPVVDGVTNLTGASQSAILEAGWYENSPTEFYRSAARWWFEEQP